MNTIKYNDISTDKLLEYHNLYHDMLTNMYQKDTWSYQTKYCRKDLRLLAFCLYYQYITLDIYKELLRNISPNETTERIYLSRLEKKGLLKVEIYNFETHKSTNVYSLTAKGALYLKEELPKFLEKQSYFTTNVDNICLDYFYQRHQNMPKRKNIKHYLKILHVLSYFISLKKNNLYWEQEAHITRTGYLLDLHQKSFYARKLDKSAYKIRSDAFVRYTMEQFKNELYIEQDMSTQRINLLIDKIHAYCKYVFENCYDGTVQSLVFSLYRPLPTLRYDKTKPQSIQLNNVRLALACGLLDFHPDVDKNLEEYPLKYVIQSLDKCVNKLQNNKDLKEYTRFFSNTKDVIEDIMSAYDVKTMEELIWAMQGKRMCQQSPTMKIQEQLRNSYCSRRLSIFQAIQEDDIAMTSLKKGCSICTVPTHLVEEYIPYMFCGFGNIENNIFSVGYECDYLFETKDVTLYEPITKTLAKDNYVLRNHFCFNNKNVYIECISDDVGGYVRVKEYMDKLKFSGEPGLLICTISPDKESLDIARKLWLNSNYVKAYTDGAELPLAVVFIRYTDLQDNRSCPFIFNSSGEEITFSYETDYDSE